MSAASAAAASGVIPMQAQQEPPEHFFEMDQWHGLVYARGRLIADYNGRQIPVSIDRSRRSRRQMADPEILKDYSTP